MHRRHLGAHAGRLLLAAMLVLAAWALLAGADCAAAAPEAVPACIGGLDGIPTGPAPTFAEKPFWIVLGLVVLGWLVLAADFPAEKR